MDKEKIKQQISDAIMSNPLKSTIKKASLFGSFLHGKQSKDSDVDVLMEFKPTASVGLFEFVEIQKNLSDFMGKKVDLLTPEALSKYFRSKVVGEAELIYEG